jgi:hypothetical protein
MHNKIILWNNTAFDHENLMVIGDVLRRNYDLHHPLTDPMAQLLARLDECKPTIMSADMQNSVLPVHSPHQ